MLLVHGSGAHHGWWEAMRPDLAARHRVVELDLSGHGESGHRDASYSLGGWVAEVLAVLDELGIASVVLVGHSMGAKVGVAVAADHPDRVRGLVLLDVALPPPTRWRTRPAWIEGTQPHVSTRAELVARFRLVPSQPDPDLAVLSAVAVASVRRDGGGWTWKQDRRRMPILQDAEIGERALRLCCPVAFIHAENSVVVDQEVIDHVRTLAAPLVVMRVAGAHHHLVLERPRVCAALIDSWLDSAALYIV